MIRPIVSGVRRELELTGRVWQFLIFKFFQTKARVEVWLHENTQLRIEGKIIVSTPSVSLTRLQGFDEFMNVVLDDAAEVYPKTGTKRTIGRIVIKGDNIALICNISE